MFANWEKNELLQWNLKFRGLYKPLKQYQVTVYNINTKIFSCVNEKMTTAILPCIPIVDQVRMSLN